MKIEEGLRFCSLHFFKMYGQKIALLIYLVYDMIPFQQVQPCISVSTIS